MSKASAGSAGFISLSASSSIPREKSSFRTSREKSYPADSSAAISSSAFWKAMRSSVFVPYEKSSLSTSETPSLPRGASVSPLCRDRKSTRLNSSHGYISYAVFCLKKKNKNRNLLLAPAHGLPLRAPQPDRREDQRLAERPLGDVRLT